MFFFERQREPCSCLLWCNLRLINVFALMPVLPCKEAVCSVMTQRYTILLCAPDAKHCTQHPLWPSLPWFAISQHFLCVSRSLTKTEGADGQSDYHCIHYKRQFEKKELLCLLWCWIQKWERTRDERRRKRHFLKRCDSLCCIIQHLVRIVQGLPIISSNVSSSLPLHCSIWSTGGASMGSQALYLYQWRAWL